MRTIARRFARESVARSVLRRSFRLRGETTARTCVSTCMRASNQPRAYETFAFSLHDCRGDWHLMRRWPCHAWKCRIRLLNETRLSGHVMRKDRAPFISVRWQIPPRHHPRYVNALFFSLRAEGAWRAIRRKRPMVSRPSCGSATSWITNVVGRRMHIRERWFRRWFRNFLQAYFALFNAFVDSKLLFTFIHLYMLYAYNIYDIFQHREAEVTYRRRRDFKF